MGEIKHKTKVTLERWQQAQAWENSVWAGWPIDGDDWNVYWKDKFENYNFLKNYTINSVLEVGCGPWAQNTRNALKVIGENKEIYLEDPLIQSYINQNKFVKNLKATFISQPLEDLNINKKFDLVICINVLDHVRDVELCFDAMYRHLNVNGILVFGQDLSDQTDLTTYPVEDVGHPIRVDADICNNFLKRTEPILNKFLPRSEGRNPGAHYGMLIYAGKFIG